MDRIADCSPIAVGARDRFAEERLPPDDTWPDLDPEAAGLHFPPRLNAAAQLLSTVPAGELARRIAFIGEHETWTYERLINTVDAIAHVLTRDCGLVPGGRVLLRGPNTPRLAACWLAIIKAGGIVVSTMPLLRGRELVPMLRKTEPTIALCDCRYLEELELGVKQSGLKIMIVDYDGGCAYGDDRGEGLEGLARRYNVPFAAADTAADEVALIGFTSGTSGAPKAAAHFHRDLLAVADLSPRSILQTRADDVFCGAPSMAFAYGMGGLMLFPLRVGATSVLVDRATPDKLFDAIIEHKGSILFAVPTAYRSLTTLIVDRKIPRDAFSHLRLCVSAGEPLPEATAEAWRAATGHGILDSLGTTEMLNAVLHAAPGEERAGSIGRAVKGYEVRVVDADMETLPPGQTGRLAVRGPTGCRYLDDSRQTNYVKQGWNLTGDAGWMDEDGYFFHQGRTDDMIVSGAYKLSGVEVEDVLLKHPAVAECAVVAAPDSLRGYIPCAYVVLEDGQQASAALAESMQDFVRERIAPFKYPRMVMFVQSLPRTETGKIQRYRLRQQAEEDVSLCECMRVPSTFGKAGRG